VTDDFGFPATGSAQVHILQEGYARDAGDSSAVASTVTLIVDGDAVIIVDPGMVPSRERLLAALAGHGPGPGDVTDVVFSHHQPRCSRRPGSTTTGPSTWTTSGPTGTPRGPG
jgi:glyoxylase-like metal-dependent hydrolase (beta-lactamase superfamily II)